MFGNGLISGEHIMTRIFSLIVILFGVFGPPRHSLHAKEWAANFQKIVFNVWHFCCGIPEDKNGGCVFYVLYSHMVVYNHRVWITHISDLYVQESVCRARMTRFYIQLKEDPHGSMISLFVGNLPTSLSQRQYRKILLDIIGEGNELFLHTIYVRRYWSVYGIKIIS